MNQASAMAMESHLPVKVFRVIAVHPFKQNVDRVQPHDGVDGMVFVYPWSDGYDYESCREHDELLKVFMDFEDIVAFIGFLDFVVQPRQVLFICPHFNEHTSRNHAKMDFAVLSPRGKEL